MLPSVSAFSIVPGLSMIVGLKSAPMLGFDFSSSAIGSNG